MFQTKAFQSTVWLALIVFILFMGREIVFVFRPAVVLITTVAFPVIVAGLLFYLTKPLVDLLQKGRVPRKLAILMVFLLGLGLLFTLLIWIIPILQFQLQSLITNLPRFLADLDRQLTELQESPLFSQVEHFEFFQRWSRMDFMQMLESWVDGFLENILVYIGSVVNFGVLLITIPFFWFYMLKDSSRFSENAAQALPEAYREPVRAMFAEISQTLSSYIKGVLTVSAFVGTFIYIGYRVIGLDYALLLAAVAMVTNVIPYFGPIIGSVPGIIVGLFISPVTALEVLVMIVIVQQIESQFIAPQVYGRRLRIHPATIIIILLTAGALAGLLGIVLGVPAYATGKVVVKHGAALIRARRMEISSGS